MDLVYLHQMENCKVAIDKQLRRLSCVMVDGGIPEDENKQKRANLQAEKHSLVVSKFNVVVQQEMILDNFSDYLVKATKEELTHIVHLMLNKVEVDFDLGRIYRIDVYMEFIELFRMRLNGIQWEENEPRVSITLL